MNKSETINEDERLYTSKNPDEIFAFYEKYNTPEKLLEYSRKRPHNEPKVVEFSGDKSVIVVVPVIDSEGENAKNFRKIFEGFHIVMVVSGRDPLFQYAHNTNIGVEHAMRHSPKWVIVANDDMYKIDEPATLKAELLKTNDKEVDFVYINPEPEQHHCHYVHLVKIRPTLTLLRATQGAFRRKFNATLRKFNVDYVFLYGLFKPHYTPFMKNMKRLVATEDFFVLSGEFISKTFEKGHIYDEDFINGVEDAWLSMMLTHARSKYVEFKIGSKISGSFGGLSESGDARGLLSRILFDYKFKKLGLDVPLPRREGQRQSNKA